MIFLLLFAVTLDVCGQPKRRQKVKRKYRKTEVMADMRNTVVHGRVRNLEREPIVGASILVFGLDKTVNTNEDGEYFLRGLPDDIISIQASFPGYKSKIIDFYLHEGVNDIYFTLDRDDVVLKEVPVTAQQREQNILAISSTLTALGADFLENTRTQHPGQLSDHVPGLNANMEAPHRPLFIIRGITSDDFDPAAQPRVAVYFNQIPVSRSGITPTELFDMERVEVIKGAQGTLFGRGAQAGAISLISRKPVAAFDTYLSAAAGNFGMKEFQGMVNLPMWKEKLLLRAAAIYSFQNGYVKNSANGTLNGKNTLGGRFSAHIEPFYNVKIDLTVNYQNDNNPGTAYMSNLFPNYNGVSDIFQYEASLGNGKNLHNKRQIFGSSLHAKYSFNENNYLSSLTSFHLNSADSRQDGDGTIAPAIDMAERLKGSQLMQDLRYNFSLKSRINGLIGASYWRETVKRRHLFSPDERYFAYLILETAENMINESGRPNPMETLPNNPQLGLLAGMPLAGSHEEENSRQAHNRAYDVFMDATFLMSTRISLTAGVRGAFEKFNVSNESMMTGGSESVLGQLSGKYPNLLFKPSDYMKVERKFSSLVYRASLKYDVNSYMTAFAGYSKGRRPNVIHFDWAGNYKVLNAETVNNFDAGFKWMLLQRFWIDIGGFYQRYANFQTNNWNANTFDYSAADAGSATMYGLETTAKAAVVKFLNIFANYAYTHARIDDTDSHGHTQKYAGNRMRLTPDHSYSAGLNAKAKISDNLSLVFTPLWSWKSHIWFEDSNASGLEQNACGLLSANLVFRMQDPKLALSIFGANLLDEHYVISAGNTGALFGIPTFVPGAPRMFGTKLTWSF
ncbi:MAG: TonB-dependent receptor [Prolixibacteraceae bacterium]|nr:TonB-dependent receptor [Prolixibacteraceae bacterium]